MAFIFLKPESNPQTKTRRTMKCSPCTARSSDKNPDDPTKTHPQSHERRAVRFENIIRARNGGRRIKDKYGGSYMTKFGRTYEIPPIDVPEAQPLL